MKFGAIFPHSDEMQHGNENTYLNNELLTSAESKAYLEGLVTTFCFTVSATCASTFIAFLAPSAKYSL